MSSQQAHLEQWIEQQQDEADGAIWKLALVGVGLFGLAAGGVMAVLVAMMTVAMV